MFGSPIEGPTNVFCDNEAVFKNALTPDSTLRKKHTSICYHCCREAVASGTVRIAKRGPLLTWPICSLSHWCRMFGKGCSIGSRIDEPFASVLRAWLKGTKRIPCLIPRLVPRTTEWDIRANGHVC